VEGDSSQRRCSADHSGRDGRALHHAPRAPRLCSFLSFCLALEDTVGSETSVQIFSVQRLSIGPVSEPIL
jgi:hypothetical protein